MPQALKIVTCTEEIFIESSIIGSLIRNPAGIVYTHGLISPSDFSHNTYQEIFSIMQSLHEKGKPIDIFVIAKQLDEKYSTNSFWDAVIEIEKNIPAGIILEAYVDKLKRLSAKKQLAQTATKVGLLLNDGAEISDVIDITKADMDKIAADTTNAQIGVTGHEALNLVIEQLNNAFDGIKELRIDTHYNSLDKLLGGMRPGNLIILAARPSMGKTTLALNLMRNIFQQEKRRILLFSFEMSASEIIRSLLACVGSINLSLLKGEDMNNLQNIIGNKLSYASNIINDFKLQIVTTGSTISALKKQCREYKRQFPDCELIIIDYLQLISKPKSENRVLEISAITRELKLLAGELGVPIVALSQLNRNADARSDKTPQLSDLRDSGSIEQDADVVMFIARRDQQANIIVAKNRSGACGTAALSFNGPTATFREPDWDKSFTGMKTTFEYATA